ncbi:MAG: valine--tRNA ligase [Prevotellaceae bacterium]|jgi:valyl-tRNA synthetase|nr:valine--tRNA ligase [Prevotellaceae bacterium]
MEILAKYNPAEVEDKWYKYWMDKGFFHSEPDERESYTIVIPPPNVTGVLHMGHMLNNTLQDVFIRRARMLGKNACWVPGTDHASIATEAKVVAKLKAEGIEKNQLTREEFLTHAWEWKEKHGGIILEQLKKLGASCDWQRTVFTMDPALSEAVIDTFIHLYRKGWIYRGIRMVNWDPVGKTAVSDEEVIHKETNSKLYYIKYSLSQTPSKKEGENLCYQTVRNSSYGLFRGLAEGRKKQQTEAEAILWDCLRNKQIDGYEFRRQHIIDEFIVDFVNLEKKLIIEVGGAYHDKPEIQQADELRTQILNDLGYKVIRFKNEEILGNIDKVIETISNTIKAITPPPLDMIRGEADYIIIATTRPETIMADTAVCINPNDERYTHLHGRSVYIPLINKEIPIILDEYVTMDFGTGCLKVTPAHDLNDYELGLKHKLPVVDIFNDDGILNEKAQILVGEDRFVARKKIAKLLEEADNLEKIEDYKSPIGYSERTDAVIEPRLSLQWFLKMSDLAKPALKDIVDGTIKLIPDKFKATYCRWMENVHDWCISRQLWWGQQIPAWYLPDGTFFEVGKTAEEAIGIAVAKNNEYAGITSDMLKQDEDVVDTWFSSWLWPMSVFDPSIFANPQSKGNTDIQYYYPTNDLITAPEILFFWVARMIMAGHEFRNDIPFKNVYLTGIVRDKLGRKMSKSLGNSPDPLDLIAKYSADGVRMGMLLCSAAGNDILFDESQVEQGRNFCNKIWNAFRLVKGWQIDNNTETPDYAVKAVEWFNATLNKSTEKINDNLDKYRVSEALMLLYKLFWDDFCGWYLELIKPAYGSPIDKATYEHSIYFFDRLLKLLHPFIPFITEEIWHYLAERKDNESIMIAMQPNVQKYDATIVNNFEQARELITAIRSIRQEKNLNPREALDLFIKGTFDKSLNCILNRLANLKEIQFIDKTYSEAASAFMIGTAEFYVPLGSLLNVEEELKKLIADLSYLQGFRNSVLKKLSNEKFVNGAPTQVVDAERKKLADSEAKIKALEEQIARLS